MIGRITYIRKNGHQEHVLMNDDLSFYSSDEDLLVHISATVPRMVGPAYGHPGVAMLEAARDELNKLGDARMELSVQTKRAIERTPKDKVY